MQQKVTSTTVKGFLIGLVMIAISLTASFMGVSASGSFQWVIYCVFFLGIIFSIYQYGKQVDYNSTFGNYFAHGFKTSAMVTILMIAFLVIFMTMFPEFKEKAMEEARKKMSSKEVSQEQVEKALEITKKFFMILLIGGALVGYLLLGAIASLLGAAVTKKDPRPLEDLNQIGQ